MVVVETARLRLRHVTGDDAEFIRGLVNEPSWLENIGDRGVRTFDDARSYISRSYLAMYERYGHGLYLVELKTDARPIGVCGLLKRESLDDVDLGYAFLPAFWRQGYAYEAAHAVMHYAYNVLGRKRLIALTALTNQPSIRLLEKLGFRFERIERLTRDANESRLFVYEWPVALHAGPARAG